MARTATIGALAVDVVARTSKFEKGIKRTRGELDQTRKTVGTLDKSVKLLTRGLAAFAAIRVGAGIVRDMREVANEIDRTAKVARKLGTTNNDLIALRHAAEKLSELSGSSIDMAMQRWTRRLAEAANGMGEARAAINELRLDAQKLQQMGLADQMLEIAKAMQGIENRGDRLRLAFKFFDSEGAALVNMFENQRELRKLLAESQTLGLGIKEEDAKRVEEMNDALKDLSKTLNTIKRDIVIEFAPATAEALKGLRIMFQQAQDSAPRNFAGRAVRAAAEMERRAFQQREDFFTRMWIGMFGGGEAGRGGFTTEDGFSEREVRRLRSMRFPNFPGATQTQEEEDRGVAQARVDLFMRQVAERGRRLRERNQANAMAGAVRLLTEKPQRNIALGIKDAAGTIRDGIVTYASMIDRLQRAFETRQKEFDDEAEDKRKREERRQQEAANRMADNDIVEARSIEGFKILRENLRQTNSNEEEQINELRIHSTLLQTIADAVSGDPNAGEDLIK